MGKKFKKVYIEITNVCNLNCTFCAKTKRKPEHMSLNLFKKILKEVKPLTDEITLHVMGEPLLHPEFEEIIQAIKKEDIKVNLTTNATLVGKYKELLVEAPFRRINFSLHGIELIENEKKRYEILKELIDFTKNAQNIRDDLIIIYRLWDLKRENKINREKLLLFIENEFEVKLDRDIKIKTSKKIKNNAFIHYDENFLWPNINNNVIRETGYCHGLGTHIGILVDGTIIPCCLDSEGCINLGNIKDSCLTEILNTKRAKDMKTGFNERKLTEDLCKRCSFIDRFDLDKK
ncbi:MAG: radical SAM/SPASM domain-containing protein [Nanoarchaeota archaeon]|nr:radical SAM/SPASM domain-containing protein [Nanoarchaeota archaeon]